MTQDEIILAFEKHEENEYLKFDSIPAVLRKTKRPDLHAFMLLDRLVPGESDIVSAAEHDEFYMSVGVEELEKSKITDEQVLELVRCGVRYASEYGCLAMFA